MPGSEWHFRAFVLAQRRPAQEKQSAQRCTAKLFWTSHPPPSRSSRVLFGRCRSAYRSSAYRSSSFVAPCLSRHDTRPLNADAVSRAIGWETAEPSSIGAPRSYDNFTTSPGVLRHSKPASTQQRDRRRAQGDGTELNDDGGRGVKRCSSLTRRPCLPSATTSAPEGG